MQTLGLIVFVGNVKVCQTLLLQIVHRLYMTNTNIILRVPKCDINAYVMFFLSCPFSECTMSILK